MITKDVFIGVDVGSASVRSALFDKQGHRLGFSVKPIDQFHSNTDFVAQSSKQIWQQICCAVKESIAAAKIDIAQVRSIGFDATCSLVALNKQGEPISVSPNNDNEQNIIMWMDHRAKDEATTINLTNDPVLQYVGGEVSVEMELPKILWIKRNYPDRYSKIARFFDLADYLVWQATNADVASVCTLTCKWNYLAHKKSFSEKFLNKIGLSDLKSKIPQTVLALGESAGTLAASAAQQLGLHTNVVVASGVIDAHAGGIALIGAKPEHSLAIISGTSNCHMIVNQKPLLVAGVWGPYFAAMLPNYWLNEGGQSAAGALLEWQIRQHEAWPQLEQEAKQQGCSYYQLLNQYVAQLEQQNPYPTYDLHILADHHGNRSPRANPDTKGMVCGLTLATGISALAKSYLATMQAIAYGTLHIINTMIEAGYQIDRLIMCGGATKNPLWLREYANITGKEILLAKEEDAVNLGAAILGAVVSKAFDNISCAANAMVNYGNVISPDLTTQAFHLKKYNVYLQMYQDQLRYNQLMSD